MNSSFTRLQDGFTEWIRAVATRTSRGVKEFGNYITPSREEAYKEALLREYRKFCQALEEEAKAEAQAEVSSPKKKGFRLF